MNGPTTSTHSTATTNWHGNWWQNWGSGWGWHSSSNRHWHGTEWRNAQQDATPANTNPHGNVRNEGWEPSPLVDERIHYAQHGRPYYVNFRGLRLCATSCTASHTAHTIVGRVTSGWTILRQIGIQAICARTASRISGSAAQPLILAPAWHSNGF